MVCRLLKLSNYTCYEAEDGQDCIDFLEKKSPDLPIHLILMDYEMPRLKGPEACKILRDKGINIPIIGITGNVLNEDREIFLSCGAKSVLPKPLTLAALQQAISNL